jgi:diguanylate cyclase (GGDEF)-like protein
VLKTLQNRSATARQWSGLVLLSAGLMVATVVAIGATIWNLHGQAIAEARRTTDNLATILAQQTQRSILAIDLVLREMQEFVGRLDLLSGDDLVKYVGDQRTHGRLKELNARLSFVTSLGIIDSNGRILNYSRQWPIPDINLADRDFFQHFRAADDRNVAIGNPVINRTTGTLTIHVARRLNRPDGTFMGVLIGALEVGYFEDLLRLVALSREESFLLLKTDGTVLIRYPDPLRRTGTQMPAQSDWFSVVEQGGGNYITPGYFDGRSRIVSVRPVEGYPLVFNATVPEDAALEQWRRQALGLALGTLCALACFVMLLISAGKQFRRLARSEASFAYRARHDPLTHLANRKVFDDTLETEIKNAAEKKQGLAILYLDLDHFKEINDSHGHHAGDHVLQETATRMRGVVRDTDILARLGGDEFAIIAGAIDDIAAVTKLAERLLAAIRAPYLVDGKALSLSLSIGIAIHPDHGLTATDLRGHADEALYAAKRSGRNTFRFFGLGAALLKSA